MLKQTCSQCGKKVDRRVRYCAHCGAPQEGCIIKCGRCRKSVRADASFCPYCGEPMGKVAAPAVRENRWSRPQDALAVRIEERDVKGFWSNQLIIEPGTQAIIMADGRNLGVQGPGQYTLENLIDKAEKFVALRAADRMVAVVVDTEPFDIEFGLGGIYTRDPLRVGLRVKLVVQVTDPLKFHTTMVRSATRFTQEDLHVYLANEVDNAAQEWIGERTVQELAVRTELKDELETHLEMALDQTLAANGLAFRQLRTMDYNMEHMDRIRGVQEEYLIRATELDTELAGKVKVFDAMGAAELQELAEETRKVEMYERRSKVRGRMRGAINSDKFGELRDEQEMEQFLLGMDREKLIGDDEWDRFKRTLGWRRDDELQQRRRELEDRDWARTIDLEDRDRDRAHLLARVELENRHDLLQTELLLRMDLEPAALEHEQTMARQRLEGEQALEVLRQESRLNQQRQENAVGRAEQQLDDIARRERELQDAQNELAIQQQQAETTADIARIQREQDQAEAEMAIVLLEKMKTVRRKDEEERELMRLRAKDREMQIELEAERQRQAMRLEQEQAEHERQMAERAQEQQFELDWMTQLKGMSPAELAVTARDAEKAQIVRDMQQTEAMGGMTERQILAMMAGNSPAAAQALTEIAKAGAEGKLGPEQIEMYERLLGQTQELAQQRAAEADRLDRIRQDQARLQQDAMYKALDSQREAAVDIARATSRGAASAPPPTVIVTGSGQPTTVGGAPADAGQAPQAFRCPKCGEVVAQDANFCPNCQHQLRGTTPEV